MIIVENVKNMEKNEERFSKWCGSSFNVGYFK